MRFLESYAHYLATKTLGVTLHSFKSSDKILQIMSTPLKLDNTQHCAVGKVAALQRVAASNPTSLSHC